LPKYCCSIAQVVVTSFTKLLYMFFFEDSALQDQPYAPLETVSHPRLQESHHVSRMEALCFCRQLWSSITNLGFLLACDLLQSFDYFFLVKIPFKTSIVPTNDQLLSRSLSSQVEREIHSIPCIKHCKNCESCPLQVTWKVKFKCQICLSCLSRLSWLSCFSCLSWWPLWPRRAWYHNHENHDHQFCTFTFWQQRAF